jgi:hypothetical protein
MPVSHKTKLADHENSPDVIARNRILNTEKRVRDVVTNVMTSLHGLDWETKPSIGFSEGEIRRLEERRKDESNKLSNQPVSSRLIDYAYILDLKRIVENNWSHFAAIFQSKDMTMLDFDRLNNFRNPLAHIRIGLREHQYHLILGICGEIVQLIDRWEVGFRHNVKTYYCEFRFSAQHVRDGQMATQERATERANRWSTKLESLSLQAVVVRESDDFGKEKLIRLPKGQARISPPIAKGQYNGVNYWTSVIQAEVYTTEALDYVLNQGKHPYWALDWNLKEEINLDRLVSNIKELTGRTPNSTNLGGINDSILVEVEYGFEMGDRILRVYLGKGGYSGALATIGLRYEGDVEEGFYQLHRVISPDSILSFLLGEITLANFRSTINEAKNLPRQYS